MPILVVLTGCVAEPEEESVRTREEPGNAPVETWVHFVDVSGVAGPDFVNVSGDPEKPGYILETQSAGAAFLDYDGDAYLDLFVVNGTRLEEEPEGASNRLFHNEDSLPYTFHGP